MYSLRDEMASSSQVAVISLASANIDLLVTGRYELGCRQSRVILGRGGTIVSGSW